MHFLFAFILLGMAVSAAMFTLGGIVRVKSGDFESIDVVLLPIAVGLTLGLFASGISLL